MVSVIISTYDRPFKLLKAIESVINQNMDDWEVIVVGDLCTGETAVAVETINDPRVFYYNSTKRYGMEDHGSMPKNIGIQKSRGEFIAYLDDDDVFMPDHLRKSIEFLDQYPEVDLVYGCSNVYKFINPHKHSLRDRSFNKEELNKHPFINTCEIVHRRSLLDKLTDGLWKTVGYYNDYDFLKRVNQVGTIAHSKHVSATQHFPHDHVVHMEKQRLRRTGQKTPHVSVIIGVRGRTEFLAECIKSLNNQTVDKLSYEVIVVDQGNGEESKKCCSLFSGRILHVPLFDQESPYHRSWVCNVGVKTSVSDIFCFLDCDCLVTQDFIESIINKKPEDGKYIMRIKRKWLPEDLTKKYFEGKIDFNTAYESCDLDPNVTAIGSGFVVSRSAFFDIRGFDEKYDKGWGFEDVDCRDRLVALGCKVIEDFEKPLQIHLWHDTSGHDRIHRGDHFIYFKENRRLKKNNSDLFIKRNRGISWGEVVRENRF